jgi:hypothetical protein
MVKVQRVQYMNFRTSRRVLKAWIGQAEFRLPPVIGSVVRDLAAEPFGLKTHRPRTHKPRHRVGRRRPTHSRLQSSCSA